MRTAKEIYDEATALKKEVDLLHEHFLEIRKQPVSRELNNELIRIANVLEKASIRMSELTVEIQEARRRERGDFDYIH